MYTWHSLLPFYFLSFFSYFIVPPPSFLLLPSLILLSRHSPPPGDPALPHHHNLSISTFPILTLDLTLSFSSSSSITDKIKFPTVISLPGKRSLP